MAKWEYKEITDYDLTREGFINWLNEEGQEGWELVEYKSSISQYRDSGLYDCIFKRKIED